MIHEDDADPELDFERIRKPRTKPKQSQNEVRASLVAPEPDAGANGFATRVRVTNTERAWIHEHLAPFQRQLLIEDVLSRIKAGKEATVYLCSGHPSSGQPRIAAKLYRARATRSSKNLSQYQAGRAVLNEAGQAARAWRLHKAIAQKSKKGLAAAQTSWLMHEFELLQALERAGADVPQPIEHNAYALLMQFIGTGDQPAPTLNEVRLEPGPARRLFERVLANVELLLGLGWVHGDLSAHNLLYEPERLVLIDFPQVVDREHNPAARALLGRDLERLCQYFARAGLVTHPERLTRELWQKHQSSTRR